MKLDVVPRMYTAYTGCDLLHLISDNLAEIRFDSTDDCMICQENAMSKRSPLGMGDTFFISYDISLIFLIITVTSVCQMIVTNITTNSDLAGEPLCHH